MISVNYECTCKLLSAGKLVSAMSFEDLVFCCHSVQIFIVISAAPEKKKVLEIFIHLDGLLSLMFPFMWECYCPQTTLQVAAEKESFHHKQTNHPA